MLKRITGVGRSRVRVRALVSPGRSWAQQAGEPERRVVPDLGQEVLRRLADAFYDRVGRNAVIGPVYRRALQEQRGEEWEAVGDAGARQRLYHYMVGRFGGPQLYVERHGHPRLRRRHGGFPVTEEGAREWTAEMGKAIQDVGIEEPHRTHLMTFFAPMAQHMVNSRTQ